MVTFDVDRMNQVCRCTFDKIKSVLTIRISGDGSGLFRIEPSIGKLPACLAGRYTSINVAQKAILDYDRVLKESRTVRTEKFMEQRKLRKERRNASISESESS